MSSSNAKTLDIAIIGGGICGLACGLALRRKGHNVTIYESQDQLSEYGAGLQLWNNATRILYAWNLQDEFLEVVNSPSVMSVRRWDDDRVIGEIAHNPISIWEHGYPQWQIYRPDLQNILAEAARKAGVDIKLGCKVDAVDPEAATIKLAGGEDVKADLVIAADGIRSRIRQKVFGVKAQAYKEFCFRACIPRGKMMSDPETADLMTNGVSLAWCGPGCAVLGYPVAAGQQYNILLSVPRPADAEDVGRWGQPGDLKEVHQLLEGWCPIVRKAWALVDETARWTLGDVPAMPDFTAGHGRFVIVGDAAHAIVPHSGQGSAQALEDAASLADFLDPSTFPPSMSTAELLAQRIKAWNDFRQPRITNLRRVAYGNAKFLCMPDGPEQEQRDKMWAAMTAKWKSELAEKGEEGVRKQAAATVRDDKLEDVRTPEGRAYVFGYDAIGEAKRAVKQLA